MKRREFAGVCAGAVLSAAAPPGVAARETSAPEKAATPFPLSVMLWTVGRRLTFDERLEKVAAAGYRAAELVGEFQGWTKEEFAAARRRKRALGLEFDATAGVWHALADAAGREPFLQSLRAFIPTLRELECTRLILQSGDKVPGLSGEQMRANCIETLKRGGEIAARNGIELLLENIDPEENPNYFVTSSAEGFEMIRAVGNPHVRFLYDLFHEQVACGNLIAKLEKNLGEIGLIHVADVPGRHEPGSGEIHYPNIYRILGELGYKNYVAMEFKPRHDAVTDLRAAREMAERFGSIGRASSPESGKSNSS